MKNAFLVAWREFAENAKTKGFWIGIILFPLFIFASIRVPIWLETRGTPARYFVLVDQSGRFEKEILGSLEKDHQRNVLRALHEYAAKYAATSTNGTSSTKTNLVAISPSRPTPLDEIAEGKPEALNTFISKGGKDHYLRELRPRLAPDAPDFNEPRRMYRRVDLPTPLKATNSLTSLAQDLKPYLRGAFKAGPVGQEVALYAAILIPQNIDELIVRPDVPAKPGVEPAQGVQYWSVNLADTKLHEAVERTINSEIRRREYTARGLDVATILKVGQTYVPFADLNARKEAGQEKVGTADVIRQWAPTAFVYLLWVAIFSIVQMLLNNTIEEKSNRIIEVLLSSVTPGELMMGKLAGIAAVGLTMITSWILSVVLILLWGPSSPASIAGPILTVLRTSNLLPAFAIYFVLGFLLYAGLILSIGSICNTLKEAQNYMSVIVLVMMVPLLTMMFIPKDPNGTLATVLSWIPIYTPFVMMNRATADPPLRDLIGTMILLLGSTVLVLWLSGKIFRVGILRTGQPPKLVELIRWLKG
jgi:ABC-2 type transport system permease protein